MLHLLAHFNAMVTDELIVYIGVELEGQSIVFVEIAK
jgi:hypothetical protein